MSAPDHIDADEFYDAQPEREPDYSFTVRSMIRPDPKAAMRDLISRQYQSEVVGRNRKPLTTGDIAAAYAEFAASGRKITKLPPARAEGALKLDRGDGGQLMPSML